MRRRRRAALPSGRAGRTGKRRCLRGARPLAYLLLVGALWGACGARTALEVPRARDGGSDVSTRPSPEACLELPRTSAPTATPIGLRSFDETSCAPWSEPWRRVRTRTPPAGPPSELWRLAIAGVQITAAQPSIDGSIWVVEHHPESTAAFEQIAAYERDGALRWRSRPICEGRASIDVGPDAVGIVTVTRDDGSSVVARFAPVDGSLLSTWPVPERGVHGAVFDDTRAYFRRADGVVASCRGERALWARTVAADPAFYCARASVFRAAPAGAWVTAQDLGPLHVDPTGEIVLELEPPVTAGAPRFATYPFVEGIGAGALLVAEREAEPDDCIGTTRELRLIAYRDAGREVLLTLSPTDPGALAQLPRAATDGSFWYVEGDTLTRHVGARVAWRRDDLGRHQLAALASDGSALVVGYADRADESYLMRIRADGTTQWTHTLASGDGSPSGLHVSADGLVTLIDWTTFELVVTQTDFVPAE